MAELNFNALAPTGPRGFYQGFEQGQKEKVASEINQIKLDELKRDRDEMMQLRSQLKSLGQDPDPVKFLDALAQTGNPDYVKMAIEGKQKIKDLESYAKLGVIEPVTAMPAMPTGAPAPAPASVMRMPQAPTPTNALGSGTFGMGQPAANAMTPAPSAAPVAPAAPANALAPQPSADQVARAQQRIDQLLMFARSNPRMAGQAMAEAKILQDQLELFSKRGPAESAEVQTMRALGIPLTPAGYQQYRDAQRPERMLTPEEEKQKIRIASAGKPVTTITNVQEKAEAGAFGKMLVDQYGDISKAAGLAVKTLPSIEANLSALNKGLDTGFGTDAKAAGARVLGALGVQNAEKFATDTQTFQSNAISAVLQKQLEQKGPQTESDARRIEQVGAELGKTKGANQFILDLAKEQLRRDVEQRNFYDGWRKRTGSFDGAESAWFSGEGGKSLFDRPALKKYAAGAASAAAQIPTAATPARATPAAAPIYARNPQTNQRIMSTDGGNTWTPAR